MDCTDFDGHALELKRIPYAISYGLYGTSTAISSDFYRRYRGNPTGHANGVGISTRAQGYCLCVHRACPQVATFRKAGNSFGIFRHYAAGDVARKDGDPEMHLHVNPYLTAKDIWG
ncbi:unnamed protein product [Ectocarpus sp. 8 AP-2014]